MLGTNRLSQRGFSSEIDEDIDPMNSLNNLADAMLVMAVGLMLALVSAWQLDMADIRADIQVADEAKDLEIDTDENAPSLSDYGLSEYGKVYVDEDGTYYMVEGAENKTEDSGAESSGSTDQGTESQGTE